MNGRYAVAGGSDQSFVTAKSNCATEGCTATLVSNLGWTAVATMNGGRWNFNVVKPDGVICSDGSFADVVIRYRSTPAPWRAPSTQTPTASVLEARSPSPLCN